ncbi:YD repeat-containing protein, partial [Streptomyces sp. SolWspMP-sol7th]
TLLVYNREPLLRPGSRLGMPRGWRYVYDPEGLVARRRWPWQFRPKEA